MRLPTVKRLFNSNEETTTTTPCFSIVCRTSSSSRHNQKNNNSHKSLVPFVYYIFKVMGCFCIIVGISYYTRHVQSNLVNAIREMKESFELNNVGTTIIKPVTVVSLEQQQQQQQPSPPPNNNGMYNVTEATTTINDGSNNITQDILPDLTIHSNDDENTTMVYKEVVVTTSTIMSNDNNITQDSFLESAAVIVPPVMEYNMNSTQMTFDFDQSTTHVNDGETSTVATVSGTVTSPLTTSFNNHTTVMDNNVTTGYSLEDRKHQHTDDISSVVFEKNYDNVTGYGPDDMNQLARDFFDGTLCRNKLYPFLKQQRDHNNNNNKHEDDTRILFNITFSCTELFQSGSFGSGNYISAFYNIRILGQILGMDVHITCPDAVINQGDLLLPWFTGTFHYREQYEFQQQQQQNNETEVVPESTTTTKTSMLLQRGKPSIDSLCRDYKFLPIGYMAHDITYELRKMAIALVGVPWSFHPSEQWAKDNLVGWDNTEESNESDNYSSMSVRTERMVTNKNLHHNSYQTMQLPDPVQESKPLYPDVILDDAVIHFRCGDIIDTNHPSFGFLKFDTYTKYLSPEVKSIGIVTSPFDHSGQIRSHEGSTKKLDKCRKVVYAFVDHLRNYYNNKNGNTIENDTNNSPRITIHNNVNETIALTFARLIMANQTVIGMTSFGVFPGLASFGESYIRDPSDYVKLSNQFLILPPFRSNNENLYPDNHTITSILPNVHLMYQEPRLMAPLVRKYWSKDDGESIMNWMRNYDQMDI